MIELLVGEGADVSAQDSAGRTPLHLAAQRGTVDTVLLLTSHKVRFTLESLGGIKILSRNTVMKVPRPF